MSVVKTIDLFCDNCNQWFGGDTLMSILELRANAKQHGWTRIRNEDYLIDLCEWCTKLETL